VILLEAKPALLQVAIAEVWATFDDGSGGLSAGMRIDNPDLLQETLLFLSKQIVRARAPGRGDWWALAHKPWWHVDERTAQNRNLAHLSQLRWDGFSTTFAAHSVCSS
jgi:hypothetical protein